MFDAEGRFVQYLAVPVHARPKRVTTSPDGKTVYVAASVGLVYAFLLLEQ
jgi:DNA-binding beta-propeller fold protein YncE